VTKEEEEERSTIEKREGGKRTEWQIWRRRSSGKVRRDNTEGGKRK
jgi:hypothetical protein